MDSNMEGNADKPFGLMDGMPLKSSRDGLKNVIMVCDGRIS